MKNAKRLTSVEDFARLNSIAIKTILGNIDYQVLTRAICNASKDVKVNFLSNVSSEEWVTRIRSEMSMFTTDEEIKEAQTRLIETANSLCAEGKIRLTASTRKNRQSVPTSRLGTAAQIKAHLRKKYSGKVADLDANDCIPILRDCADIAYTEGILSLEWVAADVLTDDKYFQSALRMVLDGYYPTAIDSMLQNMKKILVSRLEQRCDVIREGVIALGNGATPYRLLKRCESIIWNPAVSI